jgi:hypothetical protein
MIRGTFTNSGSANNQSHHSVKAFVPYEFLLQTQQAELLRQYCIYPLMQLPMNDLVIESCSRPPEINADALSPDANLPWERPWFDRIDDNGDMYEPDDDSNYQFNNVESMREHARKPLYQAKSLLYGAFTAIRDARIFSYTKSEIIGSSHLRIPIQPFKTKTITIKWDFGPPPFDLKKSSFEYPQEMKKWVAIQDNVDLDTYPWPTGQATWAENRAWGSLSATSSTRWTLSESEGPSIMEITALQEQD